MSDTVLDAEIISYRLEYVHQLLLEAGLPVVSLRIDKSMDWEGEPTPEQEQQAQDILDTVVWNEIFDTDKDRLRDEIVATKNTLQIISDLQNPTNAQVVQAINFLANTLLLVLKLVARLYKN